VGPLAQPALRAQTARRSRISFAALTAAALVAALLYACTGGDGGKAATAPPAAGTPPASAATRSPTGDGIGAPQFDPARALAHVQKLSMGIGSRPAGSAAEKAAAMYIKSELDAYGYDTSLQDFPIEVFVDVKTGLAVTAPERRDIQTLAIGGSSSGTAEGGLVSAGLGRPGEFPGGLTGKVVLLQRGELTFTDKVQNAASAGAAAAIIYNNQPGAFRWRVSGATAIPAVAISQEDGQALLELLKTGPVNVRAEVQTETRSGESQNVVAKPPGGGECRLILGGHYDSVPDGPGANDNASGTATVMEIARVLAAQGRQDGACFTLFGSEEIGLVGSAHFVDSLSDDQRRRITGMLNFDMLAVGGGWPLVGSPEIVDLAASKAQALGLPYEAYAELPTNVGSDHANFIAAGIPSVMFNCFCDPNYHTANDRFEFVQEDRLRDAGALGLAVAEALLPGAGAAATNSR
jgi:aminopeptidase YwaD